MSESKSDYVSLIVITKFLNNCFVSFMIIDYYEEKMLKDWLKCVIIMVKMCPQN